LFLAFVCLLASSLDITTNLLFRRDSSPSSQGINVESLLQSQHQFSIKAVYDMSFSSSVQHIHAQPQVMIVQKTKDNILRAGAHVRIYWHIDGVLLKQLYGNQINLIRKKFLLIKSIVQLMRRKYIPEPPKSFNPLPNLLVEVRPHQNLSKCSSWYMYWTLETLNMQCFYFR